VLVHGSSWLEGFPPWGWGAHPSSTSVRGRLHRPLLEGHRLRGTLRGRRPHRARWGTCGWWASRSWAGLRYAWHRFLERHRHGGACKAARKLDALDLFGRLALEVPGYRIGLFGEEIFTELVVAVRGAVVKRCVPSILERGREGEWREGERETKRREERAALI
jgi:hypothetical protein